VAGRKAARGWNGGTGCLGPVAIVDPVERSGGSR